MANVSEQPFTNDAPVPQQMRTSAELSAAVRFLRPVTCRLHGKAKYLGKDCLNFGYEAARKLRGCMADIESSELRRGVPYDFVLRVRPDFEYRHSLPPLAQWLNLRRDVVWTAMGPVTARRLYTRRDDFVDDNFALLPRDLAPAYFRGIADSFEKCIPLIPEMEEDKEGSSSREEPFLSSSSFKPIVYADTDSLRDGVSGGVRNWRRSDTDSKRAVVRDSGDGQKVRGQNAIGQSGSGVGPVGYKGSMHLEIGGGGGLDSDGNRKKRNGSVQERGEGRRSSTARSSSSVTGSGGGTRATFSDGGEGWRRRRKTGRERRRKLLSSSPASSSFSSFHDGGGLQDDSFFTNDQQRTQPRVIQKGNGHARNKNGERHHGSPSYPESAKTCFKRWRFSECRVEQVLRTARNGTIKVAAFPFGGHNWLDCEGEDPNSPPCEHPHRRARPDAFGGLGGADDRSPRMNGAANSNFFNGKKVALMSPCLPLGAFPNSAYLSSSKYGGSSGGGADGQSGGG